MPLDARNTSVLDDDFFNVETFANFGTGICRCVDEQLIEDGPARDSNRQELPRYRALPISRQDQSQSHRCESAGIPFSQAVPANPIF